MNNSPVFLTRLVSVLVAVCLSACASYKTTSANPATIKCVPDRRSFFCWDAFAIVEIDGQPAGMSWCGSYDVDEGRHMIVVSHKGNRVFGGDFVSAGLLPIIADLEPGKRYEITGTGTAGVVRVWARDYKTGKLVSGIVERPITGLPGQGGPVFMPIVVPKR